MSLRIAFLLSLLSLAGASDCLRAADWPQQLGPERNGTTDGAGLAASWKDGKLPVAWQVNTGFGGAPPVCVAQPVYTFDLFKPGTPEASLLQPGS